jgi:hypothetical protein
MTFFQRYLLVLTSLCVQALGLEETDAKVDSGKKNVKKIHDMEQSD